jgi:hypothetical protein
MTLQNDETGLARAVWPTPHWLEDLQAYWEDQRAGAALPDGDELFLADLCEVMPNLLLAYLDPLRRTFRIEFAGASARGLLGGTLIGQYPEHAEPGTALSWIGAGYAGAGRLLPAGVVQIRHGDLMATHLPYRNARGAVGLILTAVAHHPAAGRVGQSATVLPFRRPQDAGDRPSSIL